MLPMEEDGAAPGDVEEGSAALHARLVALVRAAGGEHEGRVGVWMEHSYARAKSGAAVREMLARPQPSEPVLDVGGPEECDTQSDTQEPDDVDPEWEARVLSLAPSAMHARAARSALDTLRAFRLARLASAGYADASIKRDQARHAARAVRRALAPLWAAPNGGSGVAPWLHGAILAHGSHWAAALWRELAGELRRAVPRLAARLLPLPAPPPRDPLAHVGPPVDAGTPGPWLVWICAHGEDRWARRLRPLLHVRVICADSGAPGPAGPGPSTGPEAWVSALMGAARAALLDVLAEAGSHPVVVGGAGPGAAICGALLSGAGSAGDGALAGVRALALLAPPLLTAEGETTHLNRTEMELPLLVIAGSAGATCPRSLACELAASSSGAARRVLAVRGADDALRLPARLRRRLVPQHALDATVAEEVARWALTAAEGEALRRPPRKSAGANEEIEERHTAMHNARGLIREVEPPAESLRATRGPRRSLAAVPPAPPPPPAPVRAPTPPPPGAEAGVEELDIMQLPIVFADDEPPPTPPPPPPIKRHAAAAAAPSVTVTSGHPRGGRALNYTRVIVAKRRGGARGAGAAGGARPVLLRRTVRLLRDN